MLLKKIIIHLHLEVPSSSLASALQFYGNGASSETLYLWSSLTLFDHSNASCTRVGIQQRKPSLETHKDPCDSRLTVSIITEYCRFWFSLLLLRLYMNPCTWLKNQLLHYPGSREKSYREVWVHCSCKEMIMHSTPRFWKD